MRHRGPRHDRGAIELSVILGVVVFALVTVAVFSAILSFGRSAAQASLSSQAADAAQSVFELANSTPWAELAHLDSDPGLDDDVVLSLVPESLSGEGLQNFVTLPHERFASDTFPPTPTIIEGGTENYGTINDTFTVYTALTWEHEPGISDAGNHTANFGTKRITVLVEWREGGELESQVFTALRSPTLAEAAPTNVNVVAGGGLTVERDINAPTLVGVEATGEFTADIVQAYKWEIQMSKSPTFPDHATEVLCEGEYPDVRNTTEECTYVWKDSIGYGGSYRVKVWTLDRDDSDSTEDGIKYSNVVTFTGPTIPDLTGGKTAWNKDEIFWQGTHDLLDAPGVAGANVETKVHRMVAGQPDEVTTLPYDPSGGTRSWTTDEGESARYKVCTWVAGSPVACTNVFGPLYTIETPPAPQLQGVRPAASVPGAPGAFHANYTWTSDADSYTGAGGGGVRFDVEQRQADGSWQALLTQSTQTTLSEVGPAKKSNGYDETSTTLRVRVWNDAGFSPWTSATVTVGELPTAPLLTASAVDNRSKAPYVTYTWTAGSYAYDGWRATSPQEGSRNFAADDIREWDTKLALDEANTFSVYARNQFGVSDTVSVTLTVDGAPKTAPTVTRVNNNRGHSWTRVAGMTSIERQWRINGDTFTSVTNTTAAGQISTFSGVQQGDDVNSVARACNEWGCGPWSSWTGTGRVPMNSVSNAAISGTPHTSGGHFSWSAHSCTGSRLQAQYRVRHNATWNSWSTSRSFIAPHAHGTSTDIAMQRRCVNTVTGATATSSDPISHNPYRLLWYPSGGYNNYPDSSWNTNNFRRMEQVLAAYLNTTSGRNCRSNYSDSSAIHVNGSTFGLSSPYPRASGANSSWRSFWGETVVFQCWLNARDGSSTGNLDMRVGQRGWWGPLTTNKLRSALRYRCSSVIDVSLTTSSTNLFDAYEMHRFTACLNGNAI